MNTKIRTPIAELEHDLTNEMRREQVRRRRQEFWNGLWSFLVLVWMLSPLGLLVGILAYAALKLSH
jgi:hypothetical protein